MLSKVRKLKTKVFFLYSRDWYLTMTGWYSIFKDQKQILEGERDFVVGVVPLGTSGYRRRPLKPPNITATTAMKMRKPISPGEPAGIVLSVASFTLKYS